MRVRPVHLLLLVPVLGAAVLAIAGPLHGDADAARPDSEDPRTAPGTAAGSMADPHAAPDPHGGVLPPNHPPIGPAGGGVREGANATAGGAEDPHASVRRESAGQGATGAAAGDLTWTAPAKWTAVPSTSPMRLATYRIAGKKAGDDAELTVVRAGGSTEANIQRWMGQFDGAGKDTRSEKTVHGLKVSVVEVAGTYLGMQMGPAATPKEQWALLGGIVELGESPFFFKMTGPVETVRSARADFDALMNSVAPKK